MAQRVAQALGAALVHAGGRRDLGERHRPAGLAEDLQDSERLFHGLHEKARVGRLVLFSGIGGIRL
jgi:hypothetical protein